MKSIIPALFLLMVLISASCQEQGIKGRVEWVTGNQMPGPGKEKQSSKGIEREIYIYEPTTMDQVVGQGALFQEVKTKLNAKTNSNATGSFKIELPPGDYSVFVKETGGLFANGFDDRGRIQVVSIKPGKFTELVILVNYTAAY